MRLTLALAAGLWLWPAQLPEISWTCPMHPEIVESQKGKCPICRMALEPVRLDTIWSCPVHAVVQANEPGKCPICRRNLVQVTVALSFTCPGHPEIDQIAPGKCPDGSAMIAKRTLRAHGNHNPQHGGLFFMAPDNWHHLEGTYSQDGSFRLHLYDDYSRPLPAAKVTQIKGRLVSNETFDAATHTTREIDVVPLTPGANGQYLEAKIAPIAPPAQMTAKITIVPGGPEYRFDFTFQEYSKDPARDRMAVVAAGVDASQLPIEIPGNARDVLPLISARNRQIRDLIQRGGFAELYVPALQAKDLALALDVLVTNLAPSDRARLTMAIGRLVRSAWLLDTYGDLGNRQQIAEAYDMFASAVAEIESVLRAKG